MLINNTTRMAENMFEQVKPAEEKPVVEDVVNRKLPEQVVEDKDVKSKKDVITEDSESFGMPLSEAEKNLNFAGKKLVNDKDDRHEALTGKRYL